MAEPLDLTILRNKIIHAISSHRSNALAHGLAPEMGERYGLASGIFKISNDQDVMYSDVTVECVIDLLEEFPSLAVNLASLSISVKQTVEPKPPEVSLGTPCVHVEFRCIEIGA